MRSSADVVKPGQEVRVKVLEVDKENRKISLSIRKAAEAPDLPLRSDSEAGKRKRSGRNCGGLDWNYKIEGLGCQAIAGDRSMYA